jgi:hypothetical protein
MVTISSPWVTLFGERWSDEHGQQLEYWRVERAHSVIVVPLYRGQILVPHAQFRPGVQKRTVDLPGGRLPDGLTPAEAAPSILARELGIDAPARIETRPLNEQGWIINSSFSNQLLYGVIARLDDVADIDASRLGEAVPDEPHVIAAFIERLECLQCRGVLQEYLLQRLL